jgi:DNA-binding transcriptional MerR regulator
VTPFLLLAPLRTNGGQRRYTVENIAVIEEIKKLKRKGMSLPDIKRKLGKGQRSEVRGRKSGAFGKSRLHILASKIGTTARFFSIFHRPDLKYERSINIASAV